jgi:hypothetical protein
VSNFLPPRSTSRKSSRDAPTPIISTPRPLLRQYLAGRAKSEATSVDEERSSPPSAMRRSSNRRSSKKHLDLEQRPNHYRANPKRKLDVAVARIVNGMNVRCRTVHEVLWLPQLIRCILCPRCP